MKHEIFKDHPQLEKVHVTSDGTAFYQETDAKNHGKSLKDKSVETVYNENFLEVVDPKEFDPADDELKAFEAEEKEKEAKVELAKSLAEFDPETTKYPEALKLFKALGLVAENAKQETIYPLLVVAKASAQEGVNTQE
jgi:hypothetical protein